jgi:HK97 family phage major capsid protein
MNLNELRALLAALHLQMRSMIEAAEKDNRGLNADEEKAYGDLEAEYKSLEVRIARLEQLETRSAQLEEPQTRAVKPGGMQAPGQMSPENRGDDRAKADKRAVRQYVHGDEGAIREMDAQMRTEARASNNTDLNITTPADGGYLVPTGHYAGIIAKANEVDLSPALGVMDVPGLGTTVNVPVQTGTTNRFVATNEVADADRDGPAFDQAAMTLVKFTKNIELSNELLEDEGSALMNFLNFYVGDALGLTQNYALITEALAGGTSVNLAAAAAVSASDVQTLVYNLKGKYTARAKWVMKRLTEKGIRSLVGDVFQYADNPGGAIAPGSSLWKYPLLNEDDNMPAIGAGNKSILFGDFNFMGRRSTGLTFLRNPFLLGTKGQVVLHYYTRVVYKTLQAEAILYGKHPTA